MMKENGHERLVNCVISGTIKAIEHDVKTKFGIMRNIQVERMNKQGSYDSIKVVDMNERCEYVPGEEVAMNVNVGARIFGNKAEPKYTIMKKDKNAQDVEM